MSDLKVDFLYKMLIVLFLSVTIGCEKETIPIPDDIIEVEFLSQVVNDTYILRIRLPDNYDGNNSNYPVLYQLDGGTTTGSVISDYENLINNHKIIEVIIVSIDYKNGDQRVRDFTPSALPGYAQSGGSEDFLSFLRYELVPMINETYRVDTLFGNTLRGHSLGGLFGSYVMFRSQETESVFSNFIIESPSWWWDDNYIFEMETNYSLNNTDLPVKAYFAAGEFEAAIMKGPFQVFEKRISNRMYPDFRSNFEWLDHQTHLDVRENPKGLIEIFGQ